jgi:hypothetical protein
MERSPMLMDWQDQYSKNGHLAKSNLHIQCDPHQNSNSILCKFIWNNKKSRRVKTILNNKRTSGGSTIRDLKLYYRSIRIKTACYWYSDRQVEQWNRTDDPEMNPYTYRYLIFEKGEKTFQWKKKTTFSTNGAGSSGC